MENSFYTLKYKTCQCPLWPTKVKIIGKYRLREDGTSYLALTECEIVKNLKLPRKKQDKRLELFRYCNYENCPCLKVFDEETNTL